MVCVSPERGYRFRACRSNFANMRSVRPGCDAAAMASEGLGAHAVPPDPSDGPPPAARGQRTVRDRATSAIWYWPIPAIGLVTLASTVDRVAAVGTAAALVAGAGVLVAKTTHSRTMGIVAFGVSLLVLGGLLARESVKRREQATPRSRSAAHRSEPAVGSMSRADVMRTRDLRGATIAGAQLAGLDLSRRELQGVHGNGVDLSGAKLRDARLDGAHLRGSDLRGAVLRGSCLRGADLTGAQLDGADVTGADHDRVVGFRRTKVIIGWTAGPSRPRCG